MPESPPRRLPSPAPALAPGADPYCHVDHAQPPPPAAAPKGKFRLTEDFSFLKAVDEEWFSAQHDGVVHNPLGAAGYVYEKELAKPLLRDLGLVPVSAKFPSPLPSASRSERVPACALRTPDYNDEQATSDAGSGSGSDSDSDSDSGISVGHDAISSTLFIHIGAQPNNSPHAGTIITFALAFLLARELQQEYAALRAHALAAGTADPGAWVDELRAVVQLDLVDTAPDTTRAAEPRDGVEFQYSHRLTRGMCAYLGDYEALLAELAAYVGGAVEHTVSYQEDLMRMPAARDAVRTLVRDRARLAGELAPEREALAMRSACPAAGCGLADKHGVRNAYDVGAESTTLAFVCPVHGAHALRLEDPDELARLELNTPLRNLARTLVYMSDAVASRAPGQAVPARVHMRVTGGDYAGQYQERMLFRQLAMLRKGTEPAMKDALDEVPLIVYSPLVTDWSGAKLSKSLYVKEGAYEYLPASEKDRLMAYSTMSARDRRVLFAMVEGWVREPTKLFRSYTVDYVRLVFEKAAQMEAEVEL